MPVTGRSQKKSGNVFNKERSAQGHQDGCHQEFMRRPVADGFEQEQVEAQPQKHEDRHDQDGRNEWINAQPHENPVAQKGPQQQKLSMRQIEDI